MKRILILTIISAVFYSFAQAQVPGYRGKRFYVSYDLNFFPALSNPTYGEETQSNITDYHGMNVRHAIEADYVVSRTNSIGLSYGFFRSRFEHQSDTGWTYFPSLKCNVIGLNYTVFLKNKGSLAPFGAYAKISGELITYKAITDLESEPKSFKGTPNLKSINITIGEQKIYFDRLILDVGAQFGLVQGLLAFEPTEADINFDAARRLRNHYVMNVHARIGFLIF
jgi:hypothetical protein